MELKQSKVSELGKYLQREDQYVVEELVVGFIVISLGVMGIALMFIK